MNRIFATLLATLVLVIFMAMPLISGTAQGAGCEQWAGKVTSVQGVVESLGGGETEWKPVKLNDTLCPGDKVNVRQNSRADIELNNEGVMRLSENSELTMEGAVEDKSSALELVKGAGHFFSTKPNSLEVKTPFTVAGVRGTEFVINVDNNKTALSIFVGHVLASNNYGSVELTGGQSAVAEAGKAPVRTVVVKPRDAVQWALYYPPLIYAPEGALQAARGGPDAGAYVQRASELLAVGSIDEAKANIDKALAIDPNLSDAYALQSIIAVVQNDKDKALGLAQSAVKADEKSATAYLALSYAQQARFDVEGARKSLLEAINQEPQNALAWARLAEVWSMSGNLDKSLEAAQKAASLAPDLSRTQTVLGFAYLLEINTREAKKAFEKAIQFDQADPMPRLGLGLAIIREGCLHEGGKQLEIAASLDPNNSLIRSYLGKVFYEEKRGPLDEREYKIAEELDPKDPTPWLYDAISKQTTNRPVEALHDYQEAIALNDNRAVYRSKLLLDSDAAARSASLAYVYNDLGFQQRALVEGWNSVNLDPTNYSAHRFLADSYTMLPRHEIARVSELLQAQLLQPLNITPIQPQLAEANLFLISSLGPSAAGFNEFNPLLFARNRVAFTADGIVGNQGTYAGEGIISAIYDKFAFSGGYSHFQTDGWRQNAFQEDKVGNFFAQTELTPKTSIQFEFRNRDDTRGDVLMRFFEDNFAPNLRQGDDTSTFRAGFHHAFSPDAHFIGNFTYQFADRFVNDFTNPVTFDDKANDTSYSGELQFLFRSERVRMVTGFGYFHPHLKDDTSLDFLPPLDFMNFSDTVDTRVKHLNGYLYSYWDIPCNVTLTLGGSVDSYGESDIDQETGDEQRLSKTLFNPKFGITWNPLPDTTFRGAVFRELKRTLINNQTLEPTQVAGFNQFFDDLNGTDAWRYGVGIDQKICKDLYGGVEVSHRTMDVPSFTADPNMGMFVLNSFNWSENLARTYLYWAPYNWVGLSLEYNYEDFQRDPGSSDIKEVVTHRVPLGARFFHPCGLIGMLRLTYFNQHAAINRQDAASLTDFTTGSDNFVVVDAALSYRLPKRFGFVTVGATNLFDQHFEYADTDLFNGSIHPGRAVFGKVTLEF